MITGRRAGGDKTGPAIPRIGASDRGGQGHENVRRGAGVGPGAADMEKAKALADTASTKPPDGFPSRS